MYKEPLNYRPGNSSILFSLGFTYHLLGDYQQAIGIYHRVILDKKDTHFANYLLVRCLSDMQIESSEIVEDLAK